MNVLDLFSGIGGFSLGLERAGMRTVAFCEIEPYARAVLRKHWPDVPCYDDVRTLSGARLGADGIVPDVICGGFPCQDISIAGKGAGIGGTRSGLWSEYARIIGEFRPKFVIVENVAALLGRGLADVLGDLAALGYAAEWHCIPASAVGAPHRRDRIWIVAYPESGRNLGSGKQARLFIQPICGNETGLATRTMADAERIGRHQMVEPAFGRAFREAAASEVADSGITAGRGWWLSEPDVGRVAHGVPARVDRLKGLGNAVVPQIPELIGRAIMKVANAEVR
jgi:DNA (cytosine-5)-methyltransferase 1